MREILGEVLDRNTTNQIVNKIKKRYIGGVYDKQKPMWQQFAMESRTIGFDRLSKYRLPDSKGIYFYIEQENRLYQADFCNICSYLSGMLGNLDFDAYLFDDNTDWIVAIAHEEAIIIVWGLDEKKAKIGSLDNGEFIEVECINQLETQFVDELDGIFDDLGELDDIEDNELQCEANSEIIEDKLKHIVGQEAFKEEMLSVERFAEVNKRLIKRSGDVRIFPYHYIFSIEEGMGLTTFLQILAERFYYYGMIGSEDFIEYDGSLAFTAQPESGSIPGVFTRREDGSYKVDSSYGVVAVNISKNMTDPDFSFEGLMDILWDMRGKVLFVLLIEDRDKKAAQILIKQIKSRINCHYIPFRPYKDEELVLIGKMMLEGFGFTTDQKVEQYLLERICLERENGSFEHLRSLQKIVEEARVERLFNCDSDSDQPDYNKLRAEDFKTDAEDIKMDIDEIWSELDTIVGLETVKKKLKEITAHAKMQRELRDMGIETPDLCYHMMFTGNPGTGKTMVARILGRMFKAIGILSRGDMIETGRDGLVGRFVGQTAPKVREKVRTALGSILFIDEAYSLNGGTPDRVDYGYEAIDTLVKEMEDKRDDLIVIMAGYTEEMKKLFEMNSGLSERIPYHIEFPDYNASELTEIFIKLLGEDYHLQEGVKERIEEIFEKALLNSEKDFGNGRLARNIAERLRIKQSMRLCQQDAYEKNTLLTIIVQDVEELIKDEDIKRYLEGKESGGQRIGFL